MKHALMGLFCTVLLLSSCQKQLQTNDLNRSLLSSTPSFNSGSSLLREPGSVDCGTPLITELISSNYPPTDVLKRGMLKISNDGTNLYVTVSTADTSVKVSSIQIFYGDSTLIYDISQYSFDGWYGTNNPQINVNIPTIETTYTIQIPLSTFPNGCFYINVHAKFYVANQWGYREEFPVWTKPLNVTDQVTSFPWTAFVKYCKQSCTPPPPPPPPPTCGQLRTQTPGGWGTSPHGNNPGTYLYANFQNAFPAGLTVGCSTGHTITLTSANAVTNLLPSGGKAEKLTRSYVNPTGLKNVLVGHLVALTLSVQFDSYDPAFGQAGVTLGAMIINSGAFKGYTVSEFLAEANKVLGGCSSSFTIQQVLDTASAINENYVDGKTDKRFLTCPTK